MHIELNPPNWPEAVKKLPDWTILKSVANPDSSRVALDAWLAAGRQHERLLLTYRYYFEDYPDWNYPWTLAELREYARRFFPRWIDKTYLERYAGLYVGVETFNEHTDTRMVTDKALLRNHLLAEQAMCDVWNTEYRGRTVHSADGGEGYIPDTCRLIIVNGPVGNDIPAELIELSIQEDQLLGYHNYKKYVWGEEPEAEWEFHSGRWVSMEQAALRAPLWAFTEGGPYWDTAKGWRAAEVLGGDPDALAASVRRHTHQTNQTAAAREGRVLGPTAMFTTGNWPGYRLYTPDLMICADAMTAAGWSPAPPRLWEERMDTEYVRQQLLEIRTRIDAALAALEGQPANWWDAWPQGEIKPSRKLKATGRTVTIYKADGVTVITTRAQTSQWDVSARAGNLLRVYDQVGDLNDWWVQAQDVEPA